jgi:hypothetical protein
MATDVEICQCAELIRQAIPKKNRYERPLWEGVLELIEASGFGEQDAEVEINVPLLPGRTPEEELLDNGGFDGVQIEFMEICTAILGDHGGISMVPYPKGIGTRSLTLVFKKAL